MTTNNPVLPLSWTGTLPSDLGPCDLSVRHLTKRYEGFTLDDVALDVPRGSVVGLIGQNGAGKTTLMQAILGTVLADEGRVELFGQDVAALDTSSLSRLREGVGYVAATTSYPGAMSVRDVCRLYEIAYPHFDRATFDRLCAAMTLDAPKRKVSDLSRGMGMKLQLACVLASGARLLILDEPTAGLDPIVRDELLSILRTWMEDETHSMLISSHITSDLEHMADYIVMIDQGRVVLGCEADTINEVMGIARLRSEDLERVLADGLIPAHQARVLRQDLSWALLVPDRVAFQHAYPHLVCDRAHIDDVMTFVVKGEVR